MLQISRSMRYVRLRLHGTKQIFVRAKTCTDCCIYTVREKYSDNVNLKGQKFA